MAVQVTFAGAIRYREPTGNCALAPSWHNVLATAGAQSRFPQQSELAQSAICYDGVRATACWEPNTGWHDETIKTISRIREYR